MKGGEVEIQAKLTPDWTLTQSGGYTHAIFTSSEAGTGVLPGDTLQHVPAYTATTSLVFSRPITGDYDLIARASNVIVASSKAQTYFLTTLPGYDIVKARIGVVNDRWSGFLYVDNPTNRAAFLDNVQNYLLNIPSLNRVSTNQPRTVGLSLDYSF